MLSLVFTGLGLLFKAIGLVQWGEALVQRAQDRKTGMEQQKLADDEATVAAATKAAAIGSEVAGESDRAVIADLRKDVLK